MQTIREIYDDYVALNEPRLRPATIANFKSAMKHLFEYFGEDRKLDTIKRREVVEFLRFGLGPKDFKASSLAGLVTNYKSLWLHASDTLDTVDVDTFKMLRSWRFANKDRSPAKSRVPEVSDVVKVIRMESNRNPRIAMLMKFIALMGVRANEAGTILVRDVKMIDNVLTVTIRKSKTEAGNRTIPVHRDLVNEVRMLCYDRDPEATLLGYGINKQGRSTISAVVHQSLKKNKAAFTCHGLRHLFIDKARDAGIPKELRDMIVGHRMAGMGGVYGKGFNLKKQQEALNKIQLTA